MSEIKNDAKEATVEPLDEELQHELEELNKSLRQKSSSTTTAAARGLSKSASAPWLEKYRPMMLNEVAGQATTTTILSNCAKLGSIPNLLFYGPPGVGKTSAVLALAKQLYGWNKQTLQHSVLELNASNERGIDVIREKVKSFARFIPAVTQNGNRHPKLVILDEADSMTRDAQGALRRLMETQVGVTRFCLICNYVTKIIEPILSRTIHFRFLPLNKDSIHQRLQYICNQEKMIMPADALNTIATVAQGDMRRAIDILYSLYTTKISGGGRSPLVSVEDVLGVSGVIPSKYIDDILAVLNAAHSFQDVRMAAKQMIWDAYPPIELLRQMADRVATIASPRFDDLKRAKINLQVAATEEALINGGNPLLHLTALFAQITNILAPIPTKQS